MDVADVVRRIGVAGFPEPLAVGADEHDVRPQLRLGAERGGEQVVAFVRVRDDVVEVEILAAAELRVEERAVDVRAVFHHLHAEVALVLDLLEVLVDDLAGVEAVVGLGPHGREDALEPARRRRASSNSLVPQPARQSNVSHCSIVQRFAFRWNGNTPGWAIG